MADASNNYGEAKSYSKLGVSRSMSGEDSGDNTKTVVAVGGGQPPEFKKLFYDKHVRPGESLRVDAVILGSPKPKVKWLFNDQVPEAENVRCTMAGDTYSFVIDNFNEANCGRYSIQAENQYGRATCTAEIIFEGSEFSPALLAASPHSSLSPPPVGVQSSSSYSEEVITTKSIGGGAAETTKHVKQVSTVNGKTVATESKSIETTPLQMRDLSTQSVLPQMRDIASQSLMNATRETGIQIGADVLDKSSQIDQAFSQLASSTLTKDESCQWMAPGELECTEITTRNVSGEAAPFGISSLTNEQQNSSSFASYSHHESMTTSTIPHVDFSTTLIKDINQHHGHSLFNYEPIELIFNRFGGVGGGADHHMSNFYNSSSSAASYMREMNEFYSSRAAAAALPTITTRFEPINLIIHKPHNRSGSLPPLISRLNFNSSAADEAAYYYYHQTDGKENNYMYGANHGGDNRSMFYKMSSHSSGASRPMTTTTTTTTAMSSSFKPVELILDASSFSGEYSTGKRYRDSSLPSTYSHKRIRMPIRHKNLVTSSFIYDNNSSNDNNFNSSDNYDYFYSSNSSKNNTLNNNTCHDYNDSSSSYGNYYGGLNSSDFISGGQNNYKYSTMASSVEESQTIRVDPNQQQQHQKYPTMEMLIDLKTPPSIAQPLKYVSVCEGQSAKLECIISGKNFLI